MADFWFALFNVFLCVALYLAICAVLIVLNKTVLTRLCLKFKKKIVWSDKEFMKILILLIPVYFIASYLLILPALGYKYEPTRTRVLVSKQNFQGDEETVKDELRLVYRLAEGSDIIFSYFDYSKDYDSDPMFLYFHLYEKAERKVWFIDLSDDIEKLKGSECLFIIPSDWEEDIKDTSKEVLEMDFSQHMLSRGE